MKRIHWKTMQRLGFYFVLFVTAGMSGGATGESQPVWNVRHFGAIGDGKALDTRAIQLAIDSCGKQGGKVVVPSGTYLSGTLFLHSHVTLRIAEGATLLGSTRLADYPERIPTIRSYNDLFLRHSLIYAEGLENIAIEGPGSIDGQGGSFPVVAREKPDHYKDRPYILRMVQCKDVRVENIRMRNSAMWMQHYLACENVTLRGLNVYNHCNNNNDMMDIDGCRNVVVSDCIGDTDDDAITIKCTSGRPSENISITNCIVSSHCNAVKCGTESIGGFKNITVSNVVVKPSAHPTKISGEFGGIGGIVLTLVDGGVMDGIMVSNVSITGPKTPIFLRLGDRGRTVEPGKVKPPVGRFKNIRISHVIASGAGDIGCAITGLPEHPVENVSLSHIRIAFKGGGTLGDAERILEEKPDEYPESNLFGKLSAYGFFIRHAKSVSLDQIDLSVESPEDRPALVCEDVQELDLFGLRAPGSAACESLIRFAGVRNAMVAGCRVTSPIRAFVSIQGDQTESIFLYGNDLKKAGKKYITGQGANALNIQSVPLRRKPPMVFEKINAFYFPVLLTVLFFLSSPVESATDVSRQAVVDAIDQGAEYACRALLDENGKSRCDYYPLEGRWSDYEPAWHTGQLVYALVRAYEITRKTQYLEIARKAGNWWIGLEMHDPPGLKGMVRAVHQAGIDYIVFATVSDGTGGLFRLYKTTGDRRYADVPTRAGQWMLEHMYEPASRMFYDAVDPKSGEVLKNWSPFWPEKKEQTLNDVARPNNEGSLFKDMYEYTKNPEYKKLFIGLCENLVEKQGPEGIWMDFTPNNKENGSFHPRFNIWYAESLLEGYGLIGEKRYLTAALKTGAFYTKYQQKNGAFYYKNNLDGSSDPFSVSGSTTAFAGILWLRLKQYGVGDAFQENIQRSVEWILESRYPKNHPDKNLAGGFFEVQQKSGGGKLRIYQRDIATSFCIRFLCDYYDDLSKQKGSTP